MVSCGGRACSTIPRKGSSSDSPGTGTYDGAGSTGTFSTIRHSTPGTSVDQVFRREYVELQIAHAKYVVLQYEYHDVPKWEFRLLLIMYTRLLFIGKER